MATAQPMSDDLDDTGDAGASGDPSAGAAGAQQDDGSYVIEIRVSGDKQISVCVERGAEEASEEGASDQGGQADAGDYGGSGADDDSTPVKSIKEALTLALEIFRADGVLPQSADDDFQQGFQGANS